jgi:hypothetical protein
MVSMLRPRNTIFRIGRTPRRAAMLLLLFLAELLAFPAVAQETVWVQAVAGGYEVRVAAAESYCPALRTGRGEIMMTPRVAAVENFPLVCAAPLSVGLTMASVAGIDLPLPKARPERILVLGDTGCRITQGDAQDCNDPAQWPFPSLAAAAAQLHPDLVIHVGDFLYRESACPGGNAGCAGSPWGDNWPTWAADFFTPAAPLLAAAPWVMVRGNHEACDRAGAGYARLLGQDATTACADHADVITIDLGGLTLAVIDDAAAPDTAVNRAMLPAFASELAGLASLPAPVWFVHHRPVWSPISGPLNIPVGGNRTLIAAAGKTLIPATVQLMLSGHIHAFQAINYDGDVPPQIVAGNGGDTLHRTPRNLKGAIFQGRSGVTVKDGLSAGGFGFLLFTRTGEDWTIDLYDPEGGVRGQCRLAAAADGGKARVSCPALTPSK